MFKFVLLRAVQTTVQVFSSADVPNAKCCKEILEDYNRQAKRVWDQKGVDFSVRRRECNAIQAKLLGELDKFPDLPEVEPVPPKAAAVLDLIFKKHYNSEELCLLFGRTDDKALEVQDGYAVSIAGALRRVDRRYEARANLHLRKRYGRGAPLPLLSMDSVEAMFEVCTSWFYHSQINTVSLAVGTVKTQTDVCISFIRGSSRSRTYC